jgi:5-methylcytosine-specific restriction endonuclease McrA
MGYKTSRNALWRRNVRKRIWIRWGRKCYWCNTKLHAHGNCKFTIDHVHPKVKGGSSKQENMVPSCRRCNLLKGSMSGYEFCITHGMMPLEGDVL